MSKNIIYKVYKEIKNVIYKYYNITYNTKDIRNENKNEYFSIDESLIVTTNVNQIWIIGAINNSTKIFLTEGTLTRHSETLKKFI